MINTDLLVEKAVKLFNTRGIRSSMDDLAALLHVSKRTLYEQVGNKADLILFVMDYYTKKCDEIFDKILNNGVYNDFEKIEQILLSVPKDVVFTRDQLEELKVEYPKEYDEYLNRRDKRWEITLSIIEHYIKSDANINFNKEIVKQVYMSSLSEIKESTIENPKLNFDTLVQNLVYLILNGFKSNESEYFGDVKLFDLLGKQSVGVVIFNVDKKVNSIYLSQGFLNLFEDGELKYDSDPISFIYHDDLKYFKETLNNSIKNKEPITTEYRVMCKKGLRYHALRAIQIDYQDYKNAYLAVIIDETEHKLKEEEIRISEERLKLAFEQTSLMIWECDVVNHILTLSDTNIKYLGIDSPIINNPETTLVKNGIIERGSVKIFQNYFNDIYNGKEKGICLIQVRDANNKFAWAKLSYKTIFDNGKPVKAIGINERVGSAVDVISKFNQEEQLAVLLKNELVCSIKYNITQDKCERLTRNNFYKFGNIELTYNSILNFIASCIANPEEKERFSKMFSRDGLYQCLDSGKASNHLNFRAIDADGNIKWLSVTNNFINDPYSGDKYMFGYIREIDNKMKLELSINRKVEYDIVTRLYLAETMKKMTNTVISKETNLNKKCAFAILEVNNLAAIKREYGLDVAEKVLFHIGRVLRICFNNVNIVGRANDNQFTIFFPTVSKPEEIKSRLNDVIGMANNSFALSNNNERISKINVAVFVGIYSRSNYERLYSDASGLLDNIQDSNDSIQIVDNFDSIIDEAKLTNDILPNYEIGEINKENNLLINTVSSTLRQKTSEDGINYLLQTINEYYGAFRTSIFEINKDKNTADLIFENSIGNNQQFDKISISISSVPGFALLHRRKRPATIPNIELIKDISPMDYQVLKRENITSIYVYPLIEKNEAFAYVAVSNPTDNLANQNLLLFFTYFLSNELVKLNLRNQEQHFNNFDILTNLFNNESFKKKITEYKEIPLSSMGAATIKINSLRQINSEFGNDFGDSMLILITQALKRNFRNNDLFRTDSDVFEVICPDINYHLFIEKITKSIEEIHEVRPGLVSFGYTWSDTDIDVESLIAHADELMQINRSGKSDDEGVTEFVGLKNDPNSIDVDYFETYLQPKFELSTNKVMGSEALVRYIHPERGMVPPGKFIPILEREGLVSVVDLHMLEEVCKTINRWRKEGRKIIPISVNYSRVTLLEKDILTKTLEILHRYKVKPSYIEIEITETIGNMEQKLIADIANSFIKAGISLSIDDFGSRFSSLSTLSIIPFNIVKLDKSIINDLVINPKSQVIVEYVIMMCKKLNMKSIAEGIETEYQYQEIKKRGCDYGQGYYFEKPLPISEFEKKYNPIID